MSTESDPQTTVVDPYENMPGWQKAYLRDITGAASENITESEKLGDTFADPNRLIADYNGKPAVKEVMGASDKARADSEAAYDAAVTGMTGAQQTQNAELAGITTAMDKNAKDVQGLNSEFGQAFNTTANQNAINNAAKAGTNTVTSALDSMSGAAAGIQDVDTNLGPTYDTTAEREALTGMDYGGLRNDYESEYIDAVIDPTMRRMQEDAANRAAALETSGAAIGGLTNTRMGVTQAKMAEEAALAQAEAEAKMRFDAEQASQELALQEASTRGDLTSTVAELGLSQSGQASSTAATEAELGIAKGESLAGIAGQQGSLGLDSANMNIDAASTAAGLGMSEAELDAEIARMESEFGLSKTEAVQQIQTDKAGISGQKFDAAGAVADTQAAAGNAALAGGALGMEAGTYMGSQAELERQVKQQKMQAPLTAQAWENSQQGLASGVSTPTVSTQTTEGGGPSMASQLLGAGTSIAGAAIMASDERIKHDIEPLDEALAIIRRQRPSVYAYDDPSYDRVPVAGRRSAGLMAQDLEDIPGAVIERNGVKHVDLYPLVATITAAVQSLDRQINQRGL